MFIYQGYIVKDKDIYECSIVKIEHDDDVIQLVKRTTAKNKKDANIWLDDELFRLTTGKGIWD